MTKKKIRLTMEQHGPTYQVNQDEMALAVRTYRARNGLSQAALGNRWGLSRYTIMNVENSKKVHWITAYKIFASLAEDLKKEGGNV